MRQIGSVNKRRPGVLQTIEMIASVNPGGVSPAREDLVLALASLHWFISQATSLSAAIHDVAVDIIGRLDLGGCQDGWGVRTWRTLPTQHSINDNLERQTDTEKQAGIRRLGIRIGAEVAELRRNFLPVDVTFREERAAGVKTWREINNLLFDMELPVATPGTMAWKAMTQGKMSDLVWHHSLVDLSQVYGVSDNAIKKYCFAYGVEMPPAGYWRMNKKTRRGFYKLVRKTVTREVFIQQVWRQTVSEIAASTRWCRNLLMPIAST